MLWGERTGMVFQSILPPHLFLLESFSGGVLEEDVDEFLGGVKPTHEFGHYQPLVINILYLIRHLLIIQSTCSFCNLVYSHCKKISPVEGQMLIVGFRVSLVENRLQWREWVQRIRFRGPRCLARNINQQPSIYKQQLTNYFHTPSQRLQQNQVQNFHTDFSPTFQCNPHLQYNFIVSGDMNTCQKVFTCLCCHSCACQVAMCIDQWAAYEACCLANLQCGHCCWAACAPICHTTTMGNCAEAIPHCTKGIKYCLYSCALSCVGPIDGCYNCVQYIMDVCGGNVTGFAGILKHTKWLNEKVRNAFELTNGSEPDKTFSEYRP